MSGSSSIALNSFFFRFEYFLRSRLGRRLTVVGSNRILAKVLDVAMFFYRLISHSLSSTYSLSGVASPGRPGPSASQSRYFFTQVTSSINITSSIGQPGSRFHSCRGVRTSTPLLDAFPASYDIDIAAAEVEELNKELRVVPPL